MRDPEIDDMIIKETLKSIFILFCGLLLGIIWNWFAAFTFLEIYIVIDVAELIVIGNDESNNSD